MFWLGSTKTSLGFIIFKTAMQFLRVEHENDRILRNKKKSLVFQASMNLSGLPGGSAGEESACSVGGLGSIPVLEGPLEKGTATHSMLVWKIPWTDGPGGAERLSLH